MAKIEPEYPKCLTTKDWDKQKSALAKIFKKPTGVSDELKKALKAYEGVEWTKLSVSDNMPQGKAATIEKAKEVFDNIAATYGKPLKIASEAFNTLATFLKSKSKELEKDKTFPAGTRKHMLTMADEATKFCYAIAPGTISDLIRNDYNEYVEAAKKAKTSRLNGAKTSLGYLASTIKVGKSGTVTTVDEYEEYWSEHIRGIGTGLALVLVDYPDLAPLLKQAKTQWNEGNKPKQEGDVAQAVQNTLELAEKMAAVLKSGQTK